MEPELLLCHAVNTGERETGDFYYALTTTTQAVLWLSSRGFHVPQPIKLLVRLLVFLFLCSLYQFPLFNAASGCRGDLNLVVKRLTRGVAIRTPCHPSNHFGCAKSQKRRSSNAN